MKKNIAIIVRSLDTGGAQRSAGMLSIELSKKYNVYIFLYDNVENLIFPHKGNIIDIGIAGREYARYYINYYKKLYNIDVAISFDWNANFDNIITREKEKVIVSDRNAESPNNDITDMASGYRKEMTKLLYPNADAIVAVSEGVKKDLISIYGFKNDIIRTIYNFYDINRIRTMSNLDTFCTCNSKILFPTSNRIIVSIGNLAYKKNFQRLIYQFKYVLEYDPNINLIIIGSGRIENILKELIKKLELSDKVYIVPFLANPMPYLKKADIFAFSSHQEGFPNVIFESMCLNIPIVSTDCLAGPREMIANNSDYGKIKNGFEICDRGILVADVKSDDDGTTKYLSDAIIYMLKNKDYAQNCVKNAKDYVETWSNENLLQKWLNIIENSPTKQFNYKSDLKKIIIYGAGQYARKLLQEFKKDKIHVSAFVISDIPDKKDIDGIPIYNINTFVNNKDISIIIGVENRLYVEQILKKLRQLKFNDIRFVWTTLKN